MNAELLAVERLSKRYVRARSILRRERLEVRAVEDVSFTLGEGETLAIVGESGSGKSTLVRSIVGLVRPDHGSAWWHRSRAAAPIDLFALEPAERQAVRRELQIVFQDPWSSLNPRLTAGQAIGEVLGVHGLAGRAEREDRVAELLREVGLAAEIGAHHPHAMSGGQRQRVALARALAVRPRLLVCDEPLANLDVSVQAQVLNLLCDLRAARGLSLLFVSHDLSVVRYIADRVAVMLGGRIVEEAPADTLFEAPRHAHTRELLAAIPGPG